MPRESYEIHEVDMTNPTEAAQVSQVQSRAFGIDYSWEDLRRKTDTRGSQSSLYLGCFSGSRLAGFNAFTAHDFYRDGEVYPVYQSCQTATDPEHRNRGIFSTLVEKAKTVLAKRGAAFIFGFPNPNSGPIFRTQLGFRDHGGFVLCTIPIVPGAERWFLRDMGREDYVNMDGAWCQNEAQLLDLKKRDRGEALRAFHDDGNLFWGRIETKRRFAGVPITAFAVGGMDIALPNRFRCSVLAAGRSLGVNFVQFHLHRSSPFVSLFSRYRANPFSEHLIVYDLNLRTGPDSIFNIATGVKDVF